MDRTLRVRAGLASAALEAVTAFGGSRRIARERAGLVPGDLADPRRSIELDRLALLLTAGAQELGDDALGLHIAENLKLGIMGAFSYAVLNAPTLDTAFRNIERYSASLTPGVRPSLERRERVTSFHFPLGDSDPVAYRQVTEATVLTFVRMLRQLTGPGWSPMDIAFRHPEPAETREHRRLLAVPLRFGASRDEISLATSDLEREVPHADRFLLPIVERQLEDVIQTRDEQAPWYHELEMLVASRICDGHPTIRALAPQLGVSVRTLQRRLDEQGISYRDLVANVRLRIARHYLEETATSLGEIAFLLGYSELSAFDRAFARRIGHSPGEHRKRLQGLAKIGS